MPISKLALVKPQPHLSLLLKCGFILCISLSLVQTQAARVPGFGDRAERSAAPNTIRGVLKEAKQGDYCMLRGQFIEKTSDYTFIFQDDSGSRVEVKFKPEAGFARIFMAREYFLWARVIREFNHIYLSAELFSPSNY